MWSLASIFYWVIYVKSHPVDSNLLLLLRWPSHALIPSLYLTTTCYFPLLVSSLYFFPLLFSLDLFLRKRWKLGVTFGPNMKLLVCKERKWNLKKLERSNIQLSLHITMGWMTHKEHDFPLRKNKWCLLVTWRKWSNLV